MISEQQILDLQELFLTKGIHYINVPTLQEGRELIYSFLDALRCFDSIGCVTKYGRSLPKHYFDIYRHLHKNDFKSALDHLELFFTQDFNFDFVWIELTTHEQWHLKFIQKMEELNIDQHISIIALTTE